MFKLAAIAAVVLIGAIVSTALAFRAPETARPALAPQGLIDPTAMTLTAQTRDLPLIEVDKAH
jgi:hypothetical protein